MCLCHKVIVIRARVLIKFDNKKEINNFLFKQLPVLPLTFIGQWGSVLENDIKPPVQEELSFKPK